MAHYTTIVNFLMVFLIQNTQNRDTKVIQFPILTLKNNIALDRLSGVIVYLNY